MSYQVLIGGVEHPDVMRIKFTRSAITVQCQPFTVDLPGIEGTAPGTVVEIRKGGVTRFKGRVAKRVWSGRGERTILHGFDLRRKWQTLEGVFTASPAQAALHLRNQLANTDLTEGTFDTYGSITIDYGMTEDSRFDRRRIAEDIIFITGWELYDSPAGVLDFKAQCGVDRSGSVAFRRGENLITWTDEYVESGLLRVKKIKVIGKGIGAYLAKGSAQTDDYAAGDPEKTINRKSLSVDADCASAAAAILADWQNTVKYAGFSAVDDDVPAWDIFDTIRIEDDILGIAENLRVAAYEVDWTPADGERLIVTVANVTKLSSNGAALIGEIRGREEDDFAKTAPIASVDGLPDGETYGRVLQTVLTTNQVDLSKSGVIGQIDSTKIADLAVTVDKLGALAVTADKIGALAVTADKIGALAITADKIDNATITGDKIAAATITGAKIANATITAANIGSATITGGNIAVDTIVAGNIGDLAITGDKVAVGTIAATNLGTGAVTAVKILGQAVSIDKLATDISSKTLEFLYTKFKEYSVESSTGMTMGTNVYTREILSEPMLRYRLRKLLVELKAEAYPFVDIWLYASSFAAIIITSNPLWTVAGIGTGTNIVSSNTETSPVYRNPYTTRKWLVVSAGEDASQTWQIYRDRDATDFSAQTHLTMAFDSLASDRQLRIKFHSTVDTHYYYYDWTNPSTMTCKTVTLPLADFATHGSPDWASIVRVSIEELGTPTGLTLPLAFTTNGMGYHLETVGTTSYVEISEAVNILRPVNESLYLRFDLGVGKTSGAVTVYMQYPSSDVRGVSYLEAV